MAKTYTDGIHNERFNGDTNKWNAEYDNRIKTELTNLAAQKGYTKEQTASLFPELFGAPKAPASSATPASSTTSKDTTAATKTQYPKPTQQDINYIRAHPEKADWYRAHFGLNPPSMTDLIPR